MHKDKEREKNLRFFPRLGPCMLAISTVTCKLKKIQITRQLKRLGRGETRRCAPRAAAVRSSAGERA